MQKEREVSTEEEYEYENRNENRCVQPLSLLRLSNSKVNNIKVNACFGLTHLCGSLLYQCKEGVKVL